MLCPFRNLGPQARYAQDQSLQASTFKAQCRVRPSAHPPAPEESPLSHTNTLARTHDARAHPGRPRSSQHTVRPQAYLARTHDRRGTRSPWPPSLVAAHVDTPSGTLPYQACRVGHAVRTYRLLTRISDPPLANTRPDSPDSHPRAGQAALARSSPLPTPGWPAVSSHHGQSHGRHSNTSRAREAEHEETPISRSAKREGFRFQIANNACVAPRRQQDDGDEGEAALPNVRAQDCRRA